MKQRFDKAVHRSHIGGRRNKSEGWYRIPEKQIRAETSEMMAEYQVLNCTGCLHAITALVGTGRFCCNHKGPIKTEPGTCLSKEKKNERKLG